MGHTHTHTQYATLLANRKIKIKTALRFDLIPVKMAINKGKNNNKYWQGFR